MTEQPEALRLADALEDDLEDYAGLSLPRLCQGIADDAAAELRRLSVVEAQREALLEALKGIVAMWDHHCYAHGDGQPTPLHVKARAAIKAVEEGK